MTYGLTAAGFVVKREADIIDEMKADYKSAFGQGTNVDEDSEIGQEIRVFAPALAELWSQLQNVYNATDPDSCEGWTQNQTYALNNLRRLPATYSIVTETLLGDPGTNIRARRLVEVTEGASVGERFYTTEDAEIGLDGSVEVVMEAVNPGPVAAPAGTLTKIITPVEGWDSATNAEDAKRGTALESASEFRLRRLQSLNANGTGIDYLQAQLLEMDDVSACRVYENLSALTDEDGRPSKSIEIVIDGPDTSAADEAVARKIYELKGEGVTLYGTRSVDIEIEQGDETFIRTVKFSRVADIDIWLLVQIQHDGGFRVGRTCIKTITVAEVADATEYAIELMGESFSYTSGVDATASQIIAGLAAAFNAGDYVPVTATDMGDDTLRLEADYPGYAFAPAVSDGLSIQDTRSATGDQLAARAAILSDAESLQDIGEDVILMRYYNAVSRTSDAVTGITLKIASGSVSGPPSQTANLAINSRQKAVFDSTRILIEVL